MTDEEMRVALKKAHEIRTKLDDFILHLNEMYKTHFMRNSPVSPLANRDTLEESPSPEDYSLIASQKGGENEK